MSEFIVITGLSGAGRSQAADDLEDLGWFVIDNLPPALIPKVSELASAPGTTIAKVALVVGSGPYHEDAGPALEGLRATGGRVRILFLDAATDVLVRRYESSRRPHPVSGDRSVVESIQRERELLEPVKALADVVVDTSDLNVHQLRVRMHELFGESESGRLKTSVVSFGYKHGLPLDVDVVLDCRFLPNPHWVDELRPLSGMDEPVRRYVMDQPETRLFLEKLDALLGVALPGYVKEGKSYLSIAVGCTGGRHRSVVLAQEIAELLKRHGFDATVTHRDVDR